MTALSNEASLDRADSERHHRSYRRRERGHQLHGRQRFEVQLTRGGPGLSRAIAWRTLTFWLRPAFLLRALNRFQRVAGFDRAIALASSAFTALIPLAIIAGALLPNVDAQDTAHSIITRYGLTGGGAQAVQDVLSPAGGADTSVSVLGAFLLVFALLSFSRGMQRLFEQTWELKPLSARNTFNDLVWILGLVAYIVFSWWVRGLLDGGRVQLIANLLVLPISALFLAWSGRVLAARRIEWRRLAPFAILGAALLTAYSIGAAVYLPHLFSSYASRYGVVGAVLAMISALFGLMVVLVVSATVGREVSVELDRIGRGERPPDDEVKREWDAVMEEARSRWQTLRERMEHLRRHERRRR
ncbi:MAG: YihY/virulence factor BrkB family protein [Marmoricola sp.]|nr:YihY/virulence factor BrkB family protein [Marmoricola sp.]